MLFLARRVVTLFGYPSAFLDAAALALASSAALLAAGAAHVGE